MLVISLFIAATVLLHGATKLTETLVQRKEDPKQNRHLSPRSAFPRGQGLQYARNMPVSPAGTAEPGKGRCGGGRNCSLHLCMTALVLTWFPAHPPRPASVNSFISFVGGETGGFHANPRDRNANASKRSLCSRQGSGILGVMPLQRRAEGHRPSILPHRPRAMRPAAEGAGSFNGLALGHRGTW